MIDIKLLQRDFDGVSAKLSRRKLDSGLLERAKELYLELKSAKQVLEAKLAEQNAKSKQFGELMRNKQDTTALKAELDEIKANGGELEASVRELEEKFENFAPIIPNIPDNSVPDGEDETHNVELKKVLEPKKFDFKAREHWELAEINGWIDFERGVKLSKSRFSVLHDMGARLERALINYMLDFNRTHGFKEMATPVIVNRNTLFGTGQLPKFEDDLFKIEGEELYLIPTAEVTLTNLYSDEILESEQLPIMMTAYTPCFRKEAGSGGRDIRGMIRQHQFDKVEIVAITKPEQSEEIHQKMIACASNLLTSLGLPHRLMQLCAGDMGFSAATTVDLEVWLPGQNCYREISSVSNTHDFQARRAKIRYKDERKNILCHTLNGSSLAVGRTLVAIMENYQKESGDIEIPEVLKPYLR